MTKKEMYAEIVALATAQDRQDIVDFCEHEVQLLSRKRSSSKPTKTQVENEAIKEEIVAVLGEADEKMTVGQILKALEGDYTSQKISALCRQLVNAEKVEKTIEKKVSYFSLA